jgi:hypothetical protein
MRKLSIPVNGNMMIFRITSPRSAVLDIAVRLAGDAGLAGTAAAMMIVRNRMRIPNLL